MRSASGGFKPSLRNLLVALLALALLASGAAPAPAASDNAEGGARLVRTLMTLVRSEFIEEVPYSKLVNGALAGMQKLLSEKKLPPGSLTMVAADAERDQALEHFNRQFTATARRYPQLMKDNLLTYAAIDGMLKTLDDPYTTYMTPDEYKKLKEAMSGGNFGGLGIYIELDDKNGNQLTVVEPIENTPASRAGIKARDQILRINGVSTRGMDLEAAKDMLRGKVGSKVTLTLRRAGVAEPFDVTLSREMIHVNSVSHRLIESKGHKIGYLKLRMFGDRTSEELEAAMRDLEAQGAQAFILDVRNNGGGYIVSALDVVSKFVPTGSTVVTVAERGAPEMVYRSRPNLRPTLPLVVLVNEFSASASEITAGALRDLGVGVLVGTKTYGKGSVQKIFPIQDPSSATSALKVTTAHYHTPKGADIHKVGITPDVVVTVPQGQSEDVQLARGLQILDEKLQATAARTPSAYPNSVKVNSLEEEMAYIDGQSCADGGSFQVVGRRIVQKDGYLLEEVRVRCTSGGEEKVLLFDISSFVGR